MADEKTVEFKIKTTADNSGADAASKKAVELKKRFDELSVELNKVSKDGATVKTKAILPLSMALEQLTAEAKAAGVAVEGIDKAAEALDRAAINAAKTSEALENLQKKTGDAQAKVGGMGDLFDKGGTKMERFRNGAGMLAGALATGLAIGTGIAKKAGVDFTETLATMSEWSKKAAVAINTGITKAMEWLAGKLASVAKFFGMDVAAQFLDDIKNGLDGIAEADAKRAANLEKIEKDLEAQKVATEKFIKAKTEELALFEAEVALRKKTRADILHENALKLAIAKAEKKTKTELLTIEKEGEKELFDFKVAKWEEEQTEFESIQARKLAALRQRWAEDKKFLAQEKIRETKAAALTDGMNSKAAEIKGEFIAAQNAAADGELAHLQANNKLELADFVRITKKKIELAWLASDKKIEAETARKNAEVALEDATLQMKRSSAQGQVEAAVGVANAAVGLASQAFGNTKEIQTVQAIINTYEAASKAWAQGGIYGAVLAAIALAGGFMQVEAIQSQEEPKAKKLSAPSFDDPVNDAMARRAGRQSAIDLVNHTSQGFVQQLATGQSQRQDGNTTSATMSKGGRASGGGTTINVIGSGPTQEVTRNMRRALLKYDQKIEVNVRGNRSKRVF